MKDKLAEFWVAVHEVEHEVQVWLEKDSGKSVYFRPKQEKLVRLFRLRVWSERLKIPVSEVLEMLVPVFRGVVKGKVRSGLGVSIAVLTSARSYQILLDKVEKRYPRGGNRVAWREHERERQLQVEREDEWGGFMPKQAQPVGMIGAESVEEYVIRYERYIDRSRAEMNRAERQKWRRRKAYRYNPWIR